MKNSLEIPRKGLFKVSFFKQILQNSYKVVFGNVGIIIFRHALGLLRNLRMPCGFHHEVLFCRSSLGL